MKTIDEWFRLGIQRSARGQSSVQNGPEIYFPLCWQMKVTLGFIAIGCGALLAAVATKGAIPQDPWYIILIPISIVVGLPVAIMLLVPGRVVIDSNGVRQRFWWRLEKRIAWNDFASAIHNADRSTIVYGKFGPPITFSPYLVDQLRFDREVKAFSRTDEISDDI